MSLDPTSPSSTWLFSHKMLTMSKFHAMPSMPFDSKRLEGRWGVRKKETWNQKTNTQGQTLRGPEQSSRFSASGPSPIKWWKFNISISITSDYFSPTSLCFIWRKWDNLKILYTTPLKEIFLQLSSSYFSGDI